MQSVESGSDCNLMDGREGLFPAREIREVKLPELLGCVELRFEPLSCPALPFASHALHLDMKHLPECT